MIGLLFSYPSPYGDCGSYLPITVHVRFIRQYGFRPLTGIVVLISKDK